MHCDDSPGMNGRGFTPGLYKSFMYLLALFFTPPAMLEVYERSAKENVFGTAVKAREYGALCLRYSFRSSPLSSIAPNARSVAPCASVNPFTPLILSRS